MSERPRATVARRLADHCEELVAGAALVIVVAAVCWGVLTRYVTAQPAAWAGELAQTAFAWMVFLGAAAGFKYGMHISIDMLLRTLPGRLNRAVQAAGDVLILLFLGYVLWLALLFNIESWSVPTSVLRLPRTVVYGSVFVGFAFMLVRYLQVMRHRATGATGPMFRMPGQMPETEREA
jgi:TRAP-type transport system small permease protein